MTVVLTRELELHLQAIDLHPLDRVSLEMNAEAYNELHSISEKFIILVNTHWWSYSDRERVSAATSLQEAFRMFKLTVSPDYNVLSVAMRVALGHACKTIKDRGREFLD